MILYSEGAPNFDFLRENQEEASGDKKLCEEESGERLPPYSAPATDNAISRHLALLAATLPTTIPLKKQIAATAINPATVWMQRGMEKTCPR